MTSAASCMMRMMPAQCRNGFAHCSKRSLGKQNCKLRDILSMPDVWEPKCSLNDPALAYYEHKEREGREGVTGLDDMSATYS